MHNYFIRVIQNPTAMRVTICLSTKMYGPHMRPTPSVVGRTVRRLPVAVRASEEDPSASRDNTFVNDHKAGIRELRKLLLEKRKELERKRVASFHHVKDSLGKSSDSVRDSLTTFAKSEIEFVKSLFPDKCNDHGEGDSDADVDGVSSTDSSNAVTPQVVDPLDAKMDPDYEPPKRA